MEFWKTVAVVCTVVCVGCSAGPYNSLADDQEEKIEGAADSFLPDLDDMEAKCLQKNGQAVIDNIHAEVNKTWECLEPVKTFFEIYYVELPDMIRNVSDKEQMQTALDQICGALSKVKRCVRPLVVVGLVCFTPTEAENIMSIWNAVFDGVDYACYQNGSRYIEFIENDAEECVKSRDKGVTQCADKLMSLQKEPWQDVLEFNSKTCKVLFDASSCAVNELKLCPKTRPAEIIEGLFNVLLHNLPCKKNLVKGKGSSP